MNSISETGYLKLNLFLEIIGKRNDGYHLIESLFAFADYGDHLTLLPSKEFSLRAKGYFASDLPNNPQDNILYKTAIAYFNIINSSYSVDISIEKNIPISAGVGGGSADAGALLRGLQKLYDPLAVDELKDLCLQLGADVPACFLSKPAYVSGIGEDILPFNHLPEIYAVFVNPLKPVSTKEVFKNSVLIKEGKKKQFDLPLNYKKFIESLASRKNDLLKSAINICPEISDIIDILKSQKKCDYYNMSGSGATCFGLFETLPEAKNAERLIKKTHKNWWVISSSLLN